MVGIAKPPRKNAHSKALAPVTNARSALLASGGFHSSQKTKEFLSALVGDVMNGHVPEKTANCSLNGVRTLLKVVDMEQRFGSVENEGDSPNLLLVPETASADMVK